MKDLDELAKLFDDTAAVWKNEILLKHCRQMGAGLVRHIKQKTPVITGNLRRNWHEKVEQTGEDVIIWAVNNVEYAPWVNDGHRIKRGGKTVGKTKGNHMLEKGFDEYKQYELNTDIESMLDDLRKELE